MIGSQPLPSLETLKQQAKRLRARLAEDGDFVSHSESLEFVARQLGFRNWNTLHAAAGNRQPPPLTLGSRVKGRYLGRPFSGEVIAVRPMSSELTRITIEFDDPVDVVKFDSFSAFRTRINAIINRNGATAEKTSDGEPHLALEAV